MATSRLKLTPGSAYLYDGTEGIYQIITGQAQALTGTTKVVASGSLQVTGSVFLQNQAAAPTPGGAEAVLYARGGTLYFKNSGGSETAVGGGGGGGTPGGSSTQVQFNDGGSSFGGDAGLTYVKGTDTLNVTNVSMTATADQTWNLRDNTAGALNISAGSSNNRWTFNTGDGQERLGFWDNVKAGFGDINDPDLTIYHDGTDSLIKNKTGQLVISGNNGVYMTGSLALSGSLTLVGDIVADRNTPRNVLTDVASITLGGAASTVTVAGDLAVNGGDISTTSPTFNIANTNATTVVVGGAATSVSLGTTTGAAWLKNANVYFSGSVYVSGSTRLGDAAGDVTQVTGSFRSRQVTGSIYTVDGTTTFLKDGSNVTTSYDNATGQWTIAATSAATNAAGSNTQVQFNDGGTAFGGDAGLTYDKGTGALTVGGDVAVNGGDVTTTATTFNLVNATATTLNIGGAATNVSLGTTTGGAWVKNANVYFSGSVYVSGSSKLGDAASDVIEVTGSFRSRHITGSIHTTNGTTPFIIGSGASATFSNSTGQWTIAAGDVVGPASSLDNQIARFDLTTGKLIQSSSVTISDVSAGLVTLDTPGSATSVNLFTSNANILTVGKKDPTGAMTVRVKLTADERLTYNGELFAGSGVLDRTASTQSSADLNGYRYVRFAGLSGNVICHIPAASTATGRVITILNGTAATHKVQISSEGGNIVGLGAASTSYYLAAAGYWAELLSNGTDWVMVCGGLLPTSSN